MSKQFFGKQQSEDVAKAIRAKQNRLDEVQGALESMPGASRGPLLQLVENLTNEIKEMEVQLPDRVELKAAQDKLRFALTQNRELQKTQERELALLNAQLAPLRAQNDELASRLATKEKESGSQAAQIRQLTTELENQSSERDMVMAAAKGDEFKRTQALEDRIRQLEQMLREAEGRVVGLSPLEGQLEALQSERALLREMLTGKDAAGPYSQLDPESWAPLMQLLTRCEELQARATELDEARHLDATEAEFLSETNLLLQQQTAELGNEIATLREQIRRLEQERVIVQTVLTHPDPSVPFRKLANQQFWAPLLQMTNQCAELESLNHELTQNHTRLEEEASEVHSLKHQISGLANERQLVLQMVHGTDPVDPFQQLVDPDSWEPLMQLIMRCEEAESSISEQSQRHSSSEQKSVKLEEQVLGLQQLMRDMRHQGEARQQLADSAQAAKERLEQQLEATRLKLLRAVSTNFKHTEARGLEAAARKASGEELGSLRETKRFLVSENSALKTENNLLRDQVQEQELLLASARHQVAQEAAHGPGPNGNSPVERGKEKDIPCEQPAVYVDQIVREEQIIQEARQHFESADQNRDGVLDRDEFIRILGTTPREGPDGNERPATREELMETLLEMDEEELSAQGSLDDVLQYLMLDMSEKEMCYVRGSQDDPSGTGKPGGSATCWR
eukprot:TRINITY_DN6629_c0_g2_i3.p1 TRINITY_DN6629_c0_g2~~TRINITY_DN6629_c0_g2_i3.p1  ORF type:complete len:681 (+),score=217.70 TRINITY_DN6629_c0_g2_i3:101-2143(+)